MPPVIDRSKCTACGICAEICCMDVLKKTEGPEPQILVRYPNECWHCRACVMDCPTGAIKMRYPLSHVMLHYEAPKEGVK